MFFETAAECGQVVETGLERNIGNGDVLQNKLLGYHDSFLRKIFIKGCICVFLE